ncbi:MAG: DNA translocase FtsK, partial [Acidobacteriota bacterium]
LEIARHHGAHLQKLSERPPDQNMIQIVKDWVTSLWQKPYDEQSEFVSGRNSARDGSYDSDYPQTRGVKNTGSIIINSGGEDLSRTARPIPRKARTAGLPKEPEDGNGSFGQANNENGAAPFGDGEQSGAGAVRSSRGTTARLTLDASKKSGGLRRPAKNDPDSFDDELPDGLDDDDGDAPGTVRSIDDMVATASVKRAEDAEERSAPKKSTGLATKIKRALADYKLPSTEMLTLPAARPEMAEADLLERARQLAEKCQEFNVSGQVKQISPGPVVTTFEFKPDPGVKYSRITSLVDDLCLGLKAESIRIDRIPGKSTVGIEVPNDKREVIRLREVIESKKFRDSDSKLSLALGKTIDGANYSADLARMPHLLIAGATGAGKSVALNAILLSLLYKATPDEVKLILVDPKRLELGLYADLPHLLTPIVTDPKRAGYALKWAVAEMENRYKHLAQFSVRNIEQYNKEVAEMKPSGDVDAPQPLPFIVIIIDELADLMMVAAREVEESITRLAQMARAVGIHLVLATQRPSVDVITGLIKANFPSRISFRVSSKVDSRTIIDTNGAEGLLGQGDMLFLGPGTSRLIRVHGAYVDEKEVKRICDFIRTQANPAYDEKIVMSEKETGGGDGGDFPRDEKYDDAVRIVVKSQKASTSLLQRHLRIGYGRAASIIDSMEREGVVGPEDGTKPRQVLVKPDFVERLDQMREEPPF